MAHSLKNAVVAGNSKKPFKKEPETDRLSGIRELARRIVNEQFSSKEELIICERSIDRLADVLEKRGYNFFHAFLSCSKKMAEGNAVVLLGMFSEKTLEQVSQFSIRGLEKWVENFKRPVPKHGIPMFNYRDGTADQRYRYATLTGEYNDVEKYKAGSAAVELEDIKESLRIFSIATFGSFLLIGESQGGAWALDKSDYIFLPKIMADFDTKEENERAYYIMGGHESCHKAFGSFEVRIEELLGHFKKEGMELRVEEESITASYKGEEHTFSHDEFVKIISLFPDETRIAALWNVFEDMRIDSRKYEEKTPGHRDAFQHFVRVMLEKRPKEEEADAWKETFFSILAITSFISAASDKEDAVKALFPTLRDRLKKAEFPWNKEEKTILELCRKLPKKDLRLMRKFRKRLLKVSLSEEEHSTESWKLAFEIKKRMKKDKKGQKSGRENIINRLGGMRMFGEPGVQSLSPQIPAERIRIGKDRKAEEVEKDGGAGARGAALLERMEEPPQIRVNRLEECDVELDSALVQKVKRLLLEITSRKHAIRTGALSGRTDARARNIWVSERKRGIIKPRDYHLEDYKKEERSVAMLSIGDASGSTGGVTGGERAIDVIVRINNSLAEAVNGVSGFRFAYGFFNRSWNGTTYYEGMNFNDQIRRTNMYPGGYNLDYEVIKFGGELLKKQRAKVRILVLNLDSMTGGDNMYRGGIDRVRAELGRLRAAGIITYVISLPPSDHYYKSAGFSEMKGYLDYIYGTGNYALIESIKQLDEAWMNFIKAKARLFKR